MPRLPKQFIVARLGGGRDAGGPGCFHNEVGRGGDDTRSSSSCLCMHLLFACSCTCGLVRQSHDTYVFLARSKTCAVWRPTAAMALGWSWMCTSAHESGMRSVRVTQTQPQLPKSSRSCVRPAASRRVSAGPPHTQEALVKNFTTLANAFEAPWLKLMFCARRRRVKERRPIQA